LRFGEKVVVRRERYSIENHRHYPLAAIEPAKRLSTGKHGLCFIFKSQIFMEKIVSTTRIPAGKGVLMLLILVSLVSAGCERFLDDLADHLHKNKNAEKYLRDFEQVNLVGSTAAYDPARIDATLVNAWGIAFSSGGTAWVNATGTGLSFVLNAEGVQGRLPVAVPSPGGPTGGLPTGIIFNGTTGFLLSNGQPARFIFVGLDGILSGWNAGTGNVAETISNKSATSVYTGLAFNADAGASFLYAANFRTGKIDVYNSKFEEVTDKPFVDPALPAGYAPFNIQSIGSNLYVLYAKVGPDGRDVPGVGNGYVSIFNSNGQFIRRFTSRGRLNAPWGIALAPASFFTGDDQVAGGNSSSPEPAILIGNFGDGRIHAYATDGRLLGPLQAQGKPMVIEGLWALSFAPTTATAVDPNRLYFAAGPDEEEQGLFGYITK
jgi:uncharacterized protein (TIGR03118 family)